MIFIPVLTLLLIPWKLFTASLTIQEANKTIQQKEKNQAILEHAKKALERSTKNPTPLQILKNKTNLMCIDTQALATLDLLKLVETFEEMKEHAPIQDLSFLKTKEHNYLYDSNNTNYLYDIKADRVLDVEGYLKQVLHSDDHETIVDRLEEKLDISFRIPNHEAIEEQFNHAKKESTSISKLCKLLEKHFSVQVTLKEDILTLGNITLSLEEIGSNKKILTQEMTHNGLKVVAKKNQEPAKENSTHKTKGRDFGGR